MGGILGALRMLLGGGRGPMNLLVPELVKRSPWTRQVKGHRTYGGSARKRRARNRALNKMQKISRRHNWGLL